MSDVKTIHFAFPYISEHALRKQSKIYGYIEPWTFCRKFHKTNLLNNHFISKDYASVNCEFCLQRMTCEHSWKYLFTGRHGSDKGDRYYHCEQCLLDVSIDCYWDPDSQIKFAESIWNKIDNEDRKILIWSNFRFFEWNVS